MSPAPRVAVVLLALATALLVALVGPLILFNPWFVSFEQQRAGAAVLLGASQPQVDAATGRILLDLWTGGDFVVRLVEGGPAVLDASERSHMADVGGLVRLLGIVALAAIVVGLFAGRALRGRPRAIGAGLLAGAGLVGALAVVAAIVFAVAFDAAFIAFHQLFFREGTYLFGPESTLIRFFPEAFWYEASLIAGAVIVASAVAVSVSGWRLLRTTDDPAG
ncbi:MAG: DUF1461 domain-containing protein [Chloroflexota bacterium]